jgi:hypothetical protein
MRTRLPDRARFPPLEEVGMTNDDARVAARRRQRLGALLLGSLGSLATVEAAENGDWILQLEPTHMEAFGHDQQVLRIREVDLDGMPAADRGTPVSLDTESRITNRFRLEYRRATWQEWTVGLDFIFFGASQGRPVRSGAAGAPIDRTIFEVADRSFTSNGPSEPLYFRVLGDTDLEVWTMDAYGVRTLAETPQRKLGLVLGARNADFDNDFHAFAGIGSAGGSLVEAGSNYERMLGPLVGVVGEMQLGRNTLIAQLSQAVVFGSADLGRSISDFVGAAPQEAIQVVPQAFETYERTQDVTIPITDLRITWLHPLGERVSLGVTANASVWSDVPVPPDIVPGAGFGGGFNKNTIVFLGVGAAIQFRF